MSSTESTTLYLVRHGEVHNPGGITYGRLARFGLSKAGWEQARLAASLLAGERLAAVYTSPQLRARQTASAILSLQHTAGLHLTVRLSEVRTSMQGRIPPPNARLFDFYDQCWSPGDETIDQIARRLEALMRRVLRLHRGGKVACVSHGDPIAIAIASCSGRDLTVEALRSSAYPRLASVTALEFAGTSGQPEITLIHP